MNVATNFVKNDKFSYGSARIYAFTSITAIERLAFIIEKSQKMELILKNQNVAVDIIIVNWNSGHLLRECLRSVTRFYPSVCQIGKVVVVDNASEDTSMDAIDDGSLPIEIILNDENRGFAAACNMGASKCSSKYLLFLNPDAQFQKEVLDKLIIFMESDKSAEIGICGPQLIGKSGLIEKSCARFPSLLSFLLSIFGIDRIPWKFIKPYQMRDWNHAASRFVDHIIGAFYLIKKSLFKELHGFDERYFVYLEDLDLSFRARQIGYKTFFLSEAKAYHHGCGCSNRVKAMRLFYSWRSRFFYVCKHMGNFSGFLILAGTITVELFLRVANGIVKLKMPEIKEAISAAKMLFTNLPKIISVAFKAAHTNTKLG